MKKRFPKIALLLALVITVAMVAGCASASNAQKLYAESPQASSTAPAMANATADFGGGISAGGRTLAVTQEMAEMDMAEPEVAMDSAVAGGVAGPSVTPVVDARKIIKNVSLQLQTLAFDAGVESIPKIAESFGGYVQDSYVEGRDMYNERGSRYANFTVRIPVERLDSFLDSMGGEFHVISKSQNSQDITDSYYDSKARLDALKIQEERLLEMLKQAAELEYLLQVEKELMNVRYEIESLTASLNRMDSYVSMSTVTITLNEVIKYEPVENVPITFGERIARAFSESWKSFGEFTQNFAVGFVAAFPFLLLLAVIAIVIIAIIRAGIKRDKAKRATSPYTPPAAIAVPEKQPPTEEEKN